MLHIKNLTISPRSLKVTRCFNLSNNQKRELSMLAMFLSNRDEMHKGLCTDAPNQILTKFQMRRLLNVSANQKKELYMAAYMAAMFFSDRCEIRKRYTANVNPFA